MNRLAFTLIVTGFLLTPLEGAHALRNDASVKGKEIATPTTTAPGKVFNINRAQAASAPGVRVALVFDKDEGILRSKGVALVRKPGGYTGLYCVRTSGLSKSAVRNLVPQVTVEYSGSYGAALGAYYRSGICGRYEIGIQTVRGDSGEFQPSDLVSFTLIAP